MRCGLTGPWGHRVRPLARLAGRCSQGVRLDRAPEGGYSPHGFGKGLYPYTKPVTGVMGRGGTDLRPPFAADLLRKHRPNLVLYFTDGCGPAPENPPRMPVIWVLTDSGQMPCKWGRKVRMNG